MKKFRCQRIEFRGGPADEKPKNCRRDSGKPPSGLGQPAIFSALESRTPVMPQGENTAEMGPGCQPCNLKVCKHSPDAADQLLAVPSSEVVTTRSPSAENSADCTDRRCPVRVCKHTPDAVDQIFAVWSPEAVRTHSPSGENTADVTLRGR